MTGGRPLVVIGAGGFGREALDVVEAMNRAVATPLFDVLGVLDDSPSEVNLERLSRRCVKYLGTIDEWLAGAGDAGYVLGVGSPAARERLDGRLVAAGLEPVTVVHPTAGLGSKVRLGAGSIICAGVQVSTNVEIGPQVHLNPNATIGHDAVLEDYVSVNPGAIVSGECRIGRGTLIGAGAVVLQSLSVGSASLVGAVACVTKDVAPGRVVVGIPAHEIR
jgi:sugar O-acyltransferase (sialic acid O-acetyltransferase NeuD family)